MKTRIKLPALVLLVWLSGFVVGCSDIDPAKGYTTKQLYRTDIKTVHVKIFENKTFRRRLEYEFHRALCRQIELHTPFKVVSDRKKADTIVYGRITSVAEKVLTQQHDLDRPLENQVVLTASVNWKDLRNGDLILDGSTFRVSGQYANLLAAGRSSGELEAAEQLARRVVEAMEQPW